MPGVCWAPDPPYEKTVIGSVRQNPESQFPGRAWLEFKTKVSKAYSLFIGWKGKFLCPFWIRRIHARDMNKFFIPITKQEGVIIVFSFRNDFGWVRGREFIGYIWPVD